MTAVISVYEKMVSHKKRQKKKNKTAEKTDRTPFVPQTFITSSEYVVFTWVHYKARRWNIYYLRRSFVREKPLGLPAYYNHIAG